MPNWCSNSVIVSAKTEEELNEFLDFCDKPHTSHWKDWRSDEVITDENTKGVFWNFLSPLDTEAYFEGDTMSKASTSENIMETIAHEMATGMDWYHWNVRNWGTKWDITLERENITIDQNNDGDYYFHWYFDTAWSPAEQVYPVMAKRFPNLSFNYEITEEANFYAGILVFEKGELITEQWIDSPTHSDFIDTLDIPCPECGWADSGNCLDNEDEDVLELDLQTTTNK